VEINGEVLRLLGEVLRLALLASFLHQVRMATERVKIFVSWD
jgi:hypothetical protein